MTDRWDITRAFERFHAFERAAGVCRLEIGGVSVWPLTRISVFGKLVLPHLVQVGMPHPDMTVPLGAADEVRRCRWLKRFYALLSRLRYGPSCAWHSRDVIFSLVSRQIRLSDGREVSQILDFFLPLLRHSYAVLESNMASVGYPPHPNWTRIFHVDGYNGRLKAFRVGETVKNATCRSAREVASGLNAAFGVAVDQTRLASMMKAAVRSRLFYFPLFVQWLKRLRVKCVVTVVNYGIKNLILSEAAHSLGIPVVELQHGTIYPSHPAYNLPEIDPLHSPDYLFAWGPHWAAQTRNYALKKTICTGYPMLEYMLAQYPSSQGSARKRIVFISQGTIGAELSRRATELVGLLPCAEFEVVYKLHPNESRTWKSLYPWLVGSGVEVVASSDHSIYELFGNAFATVGVYSTAVIEGIMWGVRAFIFGDMPGGDTMRPFLVKGLMENVSSSDELSVRLRQPGLTSGTCVDGSAFWMPHAAANVAAALDELVEKGEIT